MIECITKLRNWGNSIGLIIPKEEVIKGKLKSDQEVKAIIIPKNIIRVSDIYGKEEFSKSTKQIMKDTDKDLDTKIR